MKKIYHYKKYSLWALLYIGIVVVNGCDQQHGMKEISGFDRDKWIITDERGRASRREMVSLILKNKRQIIGLGQNEVVNLLGLADEHELYSRNQKFFHYQLNASEQASMNALDTTSYSSLLSVRFNALGYATDVFVTHRE